MIAIHHNMRVQAYFRFDSVGNRFSTGIIQEADTDSKFKLLTRGRTYTFICNTPKKLNGLSWEGDHNGLWKLVGAECKQDTIYIFKKDPATVSELQQAEMGARVHVGRKS